MMTPWITVSAIVGLGFLYVLAPHAVHMYQRYRNRRVLPCPEAKTLAEVEIDARRAALSSTIGRPALWVQNCSLWPKRKGCRDRCLSDSVD